MNGNAQDDLPLLKSTRNGKESNSITCLWNQQKNGPKFMIMLIFLYFFYSLIFSLLIFSYFGTCGASRGPRVAPLSRDPCRVCGVGVETSRSRRAEVKSLWTSLRSRRRAVAFARRAKRAVSVRHRRIVKRES